VKFLFNDANASANIIPSLEQFSQKQFNSDSIFGMIPAMQLINQVNKFLKIYFNKIVFCRLILTCLNYFS
jgi:hypothetical protein